jgi:diguanylate cyclase (GGDEF)-like protein/PAS domain S-box-containing protein
LSAGTTAIAIVGPGDALAESLADALASVGARMLRVPAEDDAVRALVPAKVEVVLLGPIPASASPWAASSLGLVRAKAIPVVVFGEDRSALARMSQEDGVVSALMPPWSGPSLALLLSASAAHHRRDLRAREELTTRLGLVEAILNESPLAIYAKDPQMRFMLSNRRHTELIGRSPAEILGHSDEDLFGAEGTGFDAMGRRVFQAGRGQSSEFVLPLQGQDRIFQETIFPIRLDGVRRIGIAGIASDLTEIRQQQAMLSERVVELDRSRRVSSLTSECVELIQRSISIEESLALATRYLTRMYPEANLAVYEKNEDQPSLTLRVREERFGSFRPTELLDPQDCWGLRTRRTYSAGRGSLRLRCRHLGTEGPEACAPLVSLDRLVGLVSVALPAEGTEAPGAEARNERWVAQFETTVQSLAGALSTVALRESLNELALVDEATDLPNQRAFLSTLQKSLARAARTREAVLVAAVEVTCRAEVQRLWGHDDDSRMIGQAASAAVAFFRADDAFARLSARVLGVVLMMKNPDDAQQRLTLFTAQLKQQCRSERGLVTVAIGLGVAPAGLTAAPGALLEAAEQALGEARRGGDGAIVRRDLPGLASVRPPAR